MTSAWTPKIAVQTIMWGPQPMGIEDSSGTEVQSGIDKMLSEARKAGYDGVEIYQHPKRIGNALDLFDMLKMHDLQLVGLAGGALSEKVVLIEEFMEIVRFHLDEKSNSEEATIHREYAKRYSELQPYAYVDEWREKEFETTLQSGIRMALHPHMFRPVQTAKDAKAILDKYPKKKFPGLSFVPDTAHLTVAGDVLVSVLEENYDRIEALHLKDWTAEFGRAYQFYSKGFVGLGKGDVSLKDVLVFLRERAYQGWLVVELDAAEEPLKIAKASRQWLHAEYGI